MITIYLLSSECEPHAGRDLNLFTKLSLVFREVLYMWLSFPENSLNEWIYPWKQIIPNNPEQNLCILFGEVIIKYPLLLPLM